MGITMIDFQTSPTQYDHWRIEVEGNVARLIMDVNPDATLVPGYELKLNSYDLSVDIELYDAIQRLRFEHPQVGAVILTSGNPKVFCAGANIRMLGLSSHSHKVNFCKFTNETRLSIEDATQNSKQFYLCAINGSSAGGGYELAMAADYIILKDDGNSNVALPEIPLLAVLPGTGGLTRLVDKRFVRKDRADFFATVEEGIQGKRAVDWNLVDEIIPSSKFDVSVNERAKEFAAKSDRPPTAKGVKLTNLKREITGAQIKYSTLTAQINRAARNVTITISAPHEKTPETTVQIEKQGADFWPLTLCREMDDLILHLRANEKEIGLWIFETEGNPDIVAGYDYVLNTLDDNWFIREVQLYWKRTLKRLDVSSRSLFATVLPGSCYVGILAEILFASDRSFMLDGTFENDDTAPATIRLTHSNFGLYPMGNDLSRLASRFLNSASDYDNLKDHIDTYLEALEAERYGLITFVPDEIDWEDEIRIAIEERIHFSPDSLTGLEANLRFSGPETMETKIFGRLTAWQNWIFQRPNAVGEKGALTLYGSGQSSNFNLERV